MYFSSAITVTFSDAVYLYFPKDTQVIFTVPGVFAVKIPLDEITCYFRILMFYISLCFPLSSGSSCSLLLTFYFAEDAFAVTFENPYPGILLYIHGTVNGFSASEQRKSWRVPQFLQ